MYKKNLKKKNTKEKKPLKINFEKINKLTENYNICHNNEKIYNLQNRIKISEDLFTKLNQNLNPKKQNFVQYKKMKNIMLSLVNDLFKNVTKKTGDSLNNEKLENYDFLLRENEILKQKLELLTKERNDQARYKIYNNRSDKEKSVLVELEKTTESINKIEKALEGKNLAKTKSLLNFYDSNKEEKVQNLTSHSININDLKLLIKDIIKEKKIFQVKNKKVLNLTMEQFLYVYLRKKYKNNNIILGWVYSIIESLHLFSNKDLFISLFTLVLKNEFDENFIGKYENFENMLREKSLCTSGNDNLKDLNQMKLDQEDCQNLLKAIYPKNFDNQKEIFIEIKKTIENTKTILTNKKSLINYLDFENILKKSYLKGHNFYIKNIRDLFRKMDKKFLGFINLEQFNLIMDKIDKEGSIIKNDVRNLVDPHHLNLVSFNKFVEFFSNYKVDVFEGQKESLINIINSF